MEPEIRDAEAVLFVAVLAMPNNGGETHSADS